MESFEAQVLYPKNNEQIDKMYAVHSLSFKVSDERFLGQNPGHPLRNILQI